LSTFLNAQNIKRVYKNLEKKEYSKAKELLDKLINEQSEDQMIFFAYMIIYGDRISSFYNPLEAYYYSRKLLEKIDNFNKEELEIITDYFSNTETFKSSLPVKKKILHAIGTIEADLIKYLREENNIELVIEAINRFPDFKYYNNLIHIRNQFEFRKYEKMMTLEGFEEFIEKYPEAAQKDKAIKYRNKLAFEKALKINTEEALNDFIIKYPDSEQYPEAVKLRNKLAFEKAKRINTIEAMEVFKQKYPDALEIAEANNIIQKLLYEKAKSIQSLELYDEFIKKYPEGIYYIDIFNLKSRSLGETYCRKYFSDYGQNIWCRCYDKLNNEDLPGGIAIAKDDGYYLGISTFSDSSKYRDAWIIRIDSEGKMLWNKTLGEQYNDSILNILTNNNDEIIILSYTQTDSFSNSFHSWLFKVDNKGKKIWSRDAGNWFAEHIINNFSNDIILGGYVIDSLYLYPKILYLNNNGKKVWERVYSVNGKINVLNLINENNILISTGKWMAMIDQKGYIIWEKLVSDSIISLTPVKGDLLLCSHVNDNIYAITLFNFNKGEIKNLWKRNLTLNVGSRIKKIYYFSDNNFYIHVKESNDKLFKLDINGNIQRIIEFPEIMKLYDIKVDKADNLIMEFLINNDVLVVKNINL